MSLFEEDDVDYEDERADTYSMPDTALLPPRETSISYGFEDLERIFLDLISTNVVPHAVILSGNEGIGKATFAYRLTRTLLKAAPREDDTLSMFGDEPAPPVQNMGIDVDDPVFRYVASGAHPDLMTIEPAEDKQGVDIEQIRKIGPFLRMKASAGGWRVVIIDRAETMNRNAQNAVLKILEEPPSKTVLILIANGIGGFLPTIRSRCRVFNCAPLAPEHLRALVRHYDPGLNLMDIEDLIEMAEGSIGKLISFIDHHAQDEMASIQGLLTAYPQIDYVAVHLFSERFAKGTNEKAWANLQDMMLHLMRTMLFCKARNSALPKIARPLTSFYDDCRLEELLKICDALQGHFENIERRSLDKRQGVLEAFMIIEHKGAL